MKKITKGVFISLEGGEGGGKTLQTKLLAEALEKFGRKVMTTREPGGTVISEQIREVVLSTKNTGIDFTTEVLLFQAARAQVYGELILPALNAGTVVIADRTRDSSVVYQGIVRGFGEELIEKLNGISTKNTYPDVTFLLDVDEKIGLKRRATEGGMDRIDLEKTDFHKQVREGYLRLAQKDKTGRWEVIDASKSVEKVHEEIMAMLKKRKLWR